MSRNSFHHLLFWVLMPALSACPADAQSFLIAPPKQGVIGESHVQRLTTDLEADSDQRAAIHRAHEIYSDRVAAARDSLQNSFAQWHREYWISLYPELDPSRPVSDFELEFFNGDIVSLEGRRELFERRGYPGGIAGRDGAREAYDQEASIRLARGFAARKEAINLAESDFLKAVQLTLTDRQWPVWDRAVRRLHIAKFDAGAAIPQRSDLPQLPDLLGLIDDACADGAELAPLAGEMRPRPSDDPTSETELSRFIVQFEHQYSALLLECERRFAEMSRERAIERDLDLNPALARAAARNERARRNLWRARFDFVDSMERLAHDRLGNEAASLWRRRAMDRLLPILYHDDTIDGLASRLADAVELNDDRREAVAAICAEYFRMREIHRERVRGLKIERACVMIVAERNALWEDIKVAQQARANLADQTAVRIKAACPELSEQIDEWREAFRARVALPIQPPDIIP